MPEIVPPKFAGVQQRPLYQRVRTVLTVLSILWLVFAVSGLGSFSGGTTSLALSLVLLYGTGIALLIVIFAVYRAVRNFAALRAGGQNGAAAVFVDTVRSAARELRSALYPAPPSGRPGVPARPDVPARRPADLRDSEKRKAAQQETEGQETRQRKAS